MVNKKGNEQKLTPDMAGYRPSREWWPDLTDYRKAMLLHHISYDEIDALIKEYAEINSDNKAIVCDFFYTCLPDEPSWVYVEFPNFDNAPHYLNLWNYQNLLVWMSQKAEGEFCLAIPRSPDNPLFLSIMDKKNPYGDSCVGIYADRDFYFRIPGEVFEWGPVPTSAFNYVAFLKETFAFDIQWIPRVSECEMRKTQITLTVPD